MEKQTQIDKEIVDSLGLDFQKITLHQKKIHNVLHGEYVPHLRVSDICSVDNQEVVGWELLKNKIKNDEAYQFLDNITDKIYLKWIYDNVITCIPAAGAATRYWCGADSNFLDTYANFPKALLPATFEGDTFLEIKLMEQTYLMPTKSNVVVVPAHHKIKFQDIISTRTSASWLVLEQTQRLSTIRFRLDGSPYVLENKLYSPVPAGHGELINLFDEMIAAFPNACALHFRNIDNIIGTHSQQIEELSLFSKSFYFLRSALDIVRTHVTNAIQNQYFIQTITDPTYTMAVNFLKNIYPNLLPTLKCDSQTEQICILEQLNKPLSVFGVVRKEKNDHGGGPVFVQTPSGKKVKMCLEMTHINPQNREKYFGENGALEFFNPVLVFFETQTGQGVKPNFKELFDDNFWLLSKRPYLNSEVLYHETVLYELIGNSEKTNLVFIEVPRSLFRPHKYFIDSIGKTRMSYGLSQIY